MHAIIHHDHTDVLHDMAGAASRVNEAAHSGFIACMLSMIRDRADAAVRFNVPCLMLDMALIPRFLQSRPQQYLPHALLHDFVCFCEVPK